MDLEFLTDTLYVKHNDEQYFVIAFDKDESDRMGNLEEDVGGRFLVTHTKTGKFSWLKLDEVVLDVGNIFEEESESGTEGSVQTPEQRAETFALALEKLTKNPIAKEWVDQIVAAISKRTKRNSIDYGL